MKRLFEIKTPEVHQYFSNKMHAKAMRDEFNTPPPKNPKDLVVVQVGPDHWRCPKWRANGSIIIAKLGCQ